MVLGCRGALIRGLTCTWSTNWFCIFPSLSENVDGGGFSESTFAEGRRHLSVTKLFIAKAMNTVISPKVFSYDALPDPPIFV